jgi:hypothetical protein
MLVVVVSIIMAVVVVVWFLRIGGRKAFIAFFFVAHVQQKRQPRADV